MRNFLSSFLVALACLAGAYYWSGTAGLLMAAILGIMEISLSFDNAVVNATVLKKMSRRWQQRFLTWGMVIAVFGVRFLFPVLIVALITGHSLQDVTLMALHQPEEYARHINSAHTQISAFGGMYLLLVFLSFFVQEHKSLHWLVWLEKRFSSMGKLESIEVVLALGTLLVNLHFVPDIEKLAMLVAGIAGIILFVLVKSVATLFEGNDSGPQLERAGLVSFLYLELLDLSFSFDGVIGAFAITRDVVIILLGLTVGAMFVRSLTVFMVRKGTLDEYLYLEHGAHYAIGALALLMLVDMSVHVPEIVTGLTGLGFILLALWSSVRAKARQAKLR